MGPFGMPWLIFIMYAVSTFGVLLLGELLLRSKKFKKMLDYYSKWDETDDAEDKEGV